MDLTKGVWERSGRDQMGAHVYAAIVSLAFLWAVALVAAGAVMSFGWGFGWLLLIGTLLASIAGIVIFSISGNWTVSLLGVSILSLSLGFMVGPVVAVLEWGAVVNALALTAAITVVMSILGIIIPKSLEGMSGFLLGGLMLLIVGGIARNIMIGLGLGDSLRILDWIGALIFTMYIVYDWNRAMRLPRTMDNAVDASGALILDVVNLFLRLALIFSGSDD